MYVFGKKKKLMRMKEGMIVKQISIFLNEKRK